MKQHTLSLTVRYMIVGSLTAIAAASVWEGDVATALALPLLAAAVFLHSQTLMGRLRTAQRDLDLERKIRRYVLENRTADFEEEKRGPEPAESARYGITVPDPRTQPKSQAYVPRQ